jgi:hypothetical protein
MIFLLAMDCLLEGGLCTAREPAAGQYSLDTQVKIAID